MNKKALKEFAVYARNELRSQIALRAQAFGITPKGSPVLVSGADFIEINGKKYSIIYKSSLQKLIKETEVKGYDNVIEEIAYTWFNRLIAIRFMEINNYLPSKVRVLSSETKGKVDPDILTDYIYTDLPKNDEEISVLISNGNREEAFRKLLIAQCNELNVIMPFLFERLTDFTELLLPESLLQTDSLINKLTSEIEEIDFQEVEIIGWLYQFYMSEKKEQVGGINSKSIKKEDLPIVTQLFTPKWIVEYMVQNSLGKLYDEWKSENNIVNKWDYYIKSSEKSPIPDISSLEEIKVIDPACGSGHVLVYAFDLLFDMYTEAGYPEREIPRIILEKNIYGLDIDKRAVQMASFALMMKGQEKNRRFLKKGKDIKLNIYELVDSTPISNESLIFYNEKIRDIEWIYDLENQFKETKQFGSLIIPKESSNFYLDHIRLLESENLITSDLIEDIYVNELNEKILPVLKQAYLLSLKYSVVVTNPPYHNKYNTVLKKFINTNYKDYKADLYSAFIYRCTQFLVQNGFTGMMTPFTWMYISSHEKLRNYLVESFSIVSLVQPEYHACYDIAHVPVCTFIIQNQINKTVGDYIRLEDFRGIELQPIKLKEAINNTVYYRYKANIKDFKAIPGAPLAYWTSEKVRKLFEDNPKLGELSMPRKGNSTSDNNRFLRLWFEVGLQHINFRSKEINYEQTKIRRWFPYNKGGAYRKWYGNNEYLIDWKEDGKEIREIPTAVIANYNYFMKPGLTWSTISSKRFSIRSFDEGYIFDNGGCCLFTSDSQRNYYLALLNSNVFHYIFGQLNPTLNFQSGEVAKFPVIYNENIKITVDNLSNENKIISKSDWDNFETSWDFKTHPFIEYRETAKNLLQCFKNWEKHTIERLSKLQKNEVEINKIFIELYGLQEEVTPDVPFDEVTVRSADRVRDTKSFLSYCIGLMMGRYSLDTVGLAFAGGDWAESKYKFFQPDSDGIIPLTDTEYFEDDVIKHLQELLVLIFGQESLAENMRWIAESLTIKPNEIPSDRIRRYFFDEFYSDHCKIYQKRPIYWMAESGPKKGFRALFFLHRYTPRTLATVRFSYVQNLQEKLRQEQRRLEQELLNPDITASMKKRYDKQLNIIIAQQVELIEFDKKLAELANQRIGLDLDDGVVVNYEKLHNVLAKIK